MTRLRTAAYDLGQMALSAVLLALLVPFGEWPLRVPFDYQGDGVIGAALVKGIAEDGPLHLTRIGAPFGADIVDWPLGMWLPLGVTSGLVRITGHPGTSLNLYWLLTIVLTGSSATWAFRRLGLAPPVASAFGLLYSFLPYVFYRNTAHFLAMYPWIPLVALLALRLAGTEPERLDRRELRITLGACFAQGLSYVYYAFFGCVLLGVAGGLAGLRTRSLRLPRLAATGIVLLVLGTAIPLVPTFAYWHREGRNEKLAAYKTVADAEYYGLKLRHLLTPIDDHPIGVLRQVAARMTSANFPLENENVGAKLGSVGSLGFLVLLAFALARAAGALGPDEQIGPAATLTLTALLLAQVGGLGSIFSVLVSPDIRGYNRISVFIAFFSLYGMAVLLSRGFARWPGPSRPRLRIAFLVSLAAFGVMDQVPRGYLARVRTGTAPQFAEDESFVSFVENQLPIGAMVFQLPHGTIPLDVSARPPLVLYDQGRAYISSRSLRWSWGSVLGRTGDWQIQTSKMSPVTMARRLVLAGFAGIWIDRFGYPEPGPRGWSTLEAALAETAGRAVSASAGGRYSFISLDVLRGRVEAELGQHALEAAREEVLSDRVLFPRWREGCSDELGSLEAPYRVCGSSAWAILRNDDLRPRRFVLRAQVRALREGRLSLSVGEFHDELALSGRPVSYHRELTIPGARKARIGLAFDGQCETGTGSCVEIIDMKAIPAGTEFSDADG